MSPFVLAHAGHWLASLMYVVPVVVVVVVLTIQGRRERRRAEDERTP
jgi:hypothetical protein